MASGHPEPHHFLGVLHTLLVSPAKQRQEGANKESDTGEPLPLVQFADP